MCANLRWRDVLVARVYVREALLTIARAIPDPATQALQVLSHLLRGQGHALRKRFRVLQMPAKAGGEPICVPLRVPPTDLVRQPSVIDHLVVGTVVITDQDLRVHRGDHLPDRHRLNKNGPPILANEQWTTDQNPDIK